MSTFAVTGPRPVRGELCVPGDKSISHRALLLAAIAEGRSVVTHASDGEDVVATASAVAALGASVQRDGNRWLVDGARLRSPADVVDLGNSGTGMRLLMGVAAGRPLTVTLTGDESLRSRPMARVAIPLRLMGANVEGERAPLTVHGAELSGIDYTLPVASAQVKSAILLAGLTADGPTTVREAVPTRAHTEEMLRAAGAAVTTEPGSVTVLPSAVEPREWTVPGDPSQAAYWLVAACCVPGGDVTVRDVYLGQARDGFLAVLTRMGADLDVDRDAGAVRARYRPLRATDVDPSEVPGLVDEVPILAVAAAVAEGTTRFAGVGELRVKETDRLAALVAELGALGVQIEAEGDELAVRGGTHMAGTDVRSHGDHRIAMALAVAGLAAAGETTIHGWEAVPTSYPGFASDLELLT